MEYELPSNLPGLQWTGLDLRQVSELNYPGSSDEQTIPKVPQKQVRMSQPLYTPVPSYLRTTSRCSTPRNEDQDEYIQRVSADTLAWTESEKIHNFAMSLKK